MRNASQLKMCLRRAVRVLMVIAPALLAACGGPAPAPTSDDVSTGSVRGGDYRLAIGEKMRIVVSGEDRLSGEFTVDPIGNIAFPLVGKVPAVGLSSKELEESLTVKLRGRYLVDPHVFVEVLSRRPFYVMGEVRAVGEYQYKPGLNVITAILLAGGYSPRANTSYVYIKRASGNEEKEFPAQASVPVYPGDIVRVPERYF